MSDTKSFEVKGGYSLEDLLEMFEGSKVDLARFKDYPKFALEYFHDKSEIADPNLHMTLQLDITGLRERYDRDFAGINSTFTAFLVYKLLLAASGIEFLRYRYIEGSWYCFDNLPLFFPVAVGGDKRFMEIIIDSPARLDFPEFAEKYCTGLEKIRNNPSDYKPVPNEIWKNMWFIGNLSYMRFTSFGVHLNQRDTGRPIFYFGQRYQQGERLYVPLYSRIDHATGDPFILNEVIEAFLES
ncbi:CatA-like O-acetyltransferase [Sedimentisphaera salicampi]|uniref:Chloramphenicol acetyltransferase n=1 Tax=Sedimentisphaera salicampi TaxID=1941349 RepID=A0A1W6LIQ8_9BACT|nr:CatA-like O-acetyltransferase [Sedimentisphaera salicampi]ARN55642.1 Chloramphenicol acetyltransferase [Sedimentisphaera salicampi]